MVASSVQKQINLLLTLACSSQCLSKVVSSSFGSVELREWLVGSIRIPLCTYWFNVLLAKVLWIDSVIFCPLAEQLSQMLVVCFSPLLCFALLSCGCLLHCVQTKDQGTLWYWFSSFRNDESLHRARCTSWQSVQDARCDRVSELCREWIIWWVWHAQTLWTQSRVLSTVVLYYTRSSDYL